MSTISGYCFVDSIYIVRHVAIFKVVCKTWNMEWNGMEWNLNNRLQGLHTYMLATTQMFLANIPNV